MNNLGVFFVKILKQLFVAIIFVISLNDVAIAQVSDNFTKSYSLNGMIYALNRDGEILLINEAKNTAEKIGITEKVNDICFYKGSITIFSAIGEKKNKIEISELKNGNFIKTKSLHIGDDFYLTANCQEKDIIIITNHNLIFLKEQKNKKIPIISIPNRISFYGIKTSNITNGKLYLGANRGEWGGFLYQINLKTGNFKSISAISGDLCEGVFNPSCDPVNSIITSPWNNKCILFSIGLEHMLSQGKINEYCEGKMREFFTTKPQSDDKILKELYENCTIPFYEIVAKNNKIIAISPFGLFQINQDGQFNKEKYPEFSDFGNFKAHYSKGNYGFLISKANYIQDTEKMTPTLIRFE